MRLSFGLVCLMLTALFAAQSLRLLPDTEQAVLEGRRALCEAIAVPCCLAAQKDDVRTINAITAALCARNPAVLSAGVRLKNGRLLSEIGGHQAGWRVMPLEKSTPDQVQVPIYQGKKLWGVMEVRFEPLLGEGLTGWWQHSLVRFLMFMAGSCFLAFAFFLKRMLRHFDPSAVIPDRVRTTLDAMAEGVLLLDADQRIVLANKAFSESVGRAPDELRGRAVSEIGWVDPHNLGLLKEGPWVRAMRSGEQQTGVIVSLRSRSGEVRNLVVNTTPIIGPDGVRRGALATFDDVTKLEQKNLQLEQMLQTLKESRDEIRRQNEDLHLLATQDPLTGCLNRRAFFAQLENYWLVAASAATDLSCLMVDIDHFKDVNDQFGHSVGDQVLQHVAGILKETTRDSDLLCRYGGEEFCLLLPRVSISAALGMAERLRQQIATRPCGKIQVSASIGLSSNVLGAQDPRELLEQADHALYVSKRAGRNMTTTWNVESTELDAAGAESFVRTEPSTYVPIPFHAVTALTSALSYRDPMTVEHCRRVADMCAAIARGLMSERDCYVLEVAALLHDIGKLGVPDAVLLKPGTLSDDEWKVMSAYDRIGVEIISAAFSSQELTDIVRNHRAMYGEGGEPGLPHGTDIPLRARILTVADAYDAIVSDRAHRKGRSNEEAFAELRRCAGRQFDPELVERLIEAASANDQSRANRPLDGASQTALRIGTQVEYLAASLDSKDFETLSTLAGHIAAIATDDGDPEIAKTAAQLKQAAAADKDFLTIVALTTELVELCRSAQSQHLATAERKQGGEECGHTCPATADEGESECAATA